MLNGVKSQQCCLSWETVAKGWPSRFCSIHYGLRARAHGTDDRYSITQVLFKNTLTNARNSIYPYLVSGHFPWKVDLLYSTQAHRRILGGSPSAHPPQKLGKAYAFISLYHILPPPKCVFASPIFLTDLRQGAVVYDNCHESKFQLSNALLSSSPTSI